MGKEREVEIRTNHIGGGCYRDRQRAYQIVATQLNRYIPRPVRPGCNAKRAAALVNGGLVTVLDEK